MKFALIITAACFLGSSVATAQVEPEVFVLDNGMKFILLPRSEEPNNIAAGWVARVGSVNERLGITGMSHFFEHLMFKGTNTIGTTDAVVDSGFTDSERKLRNNMLEIIWGEQYDRFKRGEIDDPWDEQYDTPQLASLRKELKTTMDEHRSVIIKDELASLYQSEGAVGLNAFTSEDVTFYINQLPANKLELWCWLETDRLANSVFREFFSERDVVHEERRLRTESSPIGEFQEQFNSMFWQASSYAWPVIGWPSDLNSYTLEEAQRYFDIYYQPGNLIGVLVGDFKTAEAKKMIVDYFGLLEPGSSAPPPVPTIEPTQKAPQRMVARVAAQSQVEVLYHAVPFGHQDMYALEIMSAVLNGKTGRLYKAMVEGKEIATSASAGVEPRKHAGVLSFSASVKGEATPENLENSWYEQVALLQTEPVSERELQKVKNNVVADQYRQLQSNFFLMIQLGYMEALGGWEFVNEARDKLLAITTQDIMAVANKYLVPENSSVAIYVRSEDAAPIDDELVQFDAQQQTMIKEALRELETMSKEELYEFLNMTTAQSSQVPPEFKEMFAFIVQKLQEKIDAVATQDNEGNLENGDEKEEPQDDNIEELPKMLKLTPRQQTDADTMLATFEGKPLGDLIQVYVALQAVAPGVPPEDRTTIEFVIAKLAVYISELQDE